MLDFVSPFAHSDWGKVTLNLIVFEASASDIQLWALQGAHLPFLLELLQLVAVRFVEFAFALDSVADLFQHVLGS